MGVEPPTRGLDQARRHRDRRPARAQGRAPGRRPRVPAFAAAEPPDGAREHQGRAAARPADACCSHSADDRRARRARSPSASASAPCSTASRRRSPSPTCAGSSWPRRSRAIPKLVLVDEPFAGLTASEVGAFSELIREFRDEGRAVLLVDHNVKSVAALVDRVRRDVPRRTDRRRHRRRGDARRDGAPRLPRRRAHADRARPEASVRRRARRCCRSKTSACATARRWRCRASRCTCTKASSSRVVGLNGAGKTTLFNAISGLVPLLRARSAGTAQPLARRAAPPAIARGGIVQCPETRELFGDMTRAREPRPRRPRA